MDEMFWKDLANLLIDDRIATRGVYDTIRLLLDCGYSRDDLTKLEFSQNDITHCEEEEEND